MIHSISAINVDRIVVEPPSGYTDPNLSGCYQRIRFLSCGKETVISVHVDDIHVLMPQYDSAEDSE
jgi:hypothetical protein